MKLVLCWCLTFPKPGQVTLASVIFKKKSSPTFIPGPKPDTYMMFVTPLN